MTDDSDFKSADEYHINQLFAAITEGDERLEATNIRRQFVNIARTIFDWRETVVTNVERMAALAKKPQGYGLQVSSNLRAVVILANT